MTFQMTFAIITPALICGAFADRMKFSALVIFMVLWSIFIYAPIAHWVWGGGFLGNFGVLDFAGGTVVHINAGIAGLVCALFLGKRVGYGTENMAPYNLVYAVIGASLLWVGWFGFNAGSAVAVERRGRHGHGRHPDRHGYGGVGLDVHRVARAQEAERTGHHLRRGRGSRRHHSGVGLRRSGRMLCGSARPPASAASSPQPRSRRPSATTTRSMRSASMPSAESSVRCSPACLPWKPSVERRAFSKAIPGQVFTQLEGIVATIVWSRLRHLRHPDHHQHPRWRQGEPGCRDRRSRHQPARRGGPIDLRANQRGTINVENLS